MNRNKTAIIIFIRNPVPGRVKTRIAQTAGDTAALEIYRRLLAHTHSIVRTVVADKYIFYSDNTEEQDIWQNEYFYKQVQNGNTLGDKMLNAFSYLFDKGYKLVVIIGSDCYELTTDIINKAIDSLNIHDAVIGPAKDGGYYLLGLKKIVENLFQNKAWSTHTVFQSTVDDLVKNKCSYSVLPVLSDVDTEEDWLTVKNKNL